MQIAPTTTPRAPRPYDHVVAPFARSLADTLQENGLADATFEKVLATMDRLASTWIAMDKVAFLKDLVGTNRWSTGTFVQVAKALDTVRDVRPGLPGQGFSDTRPATLSLLDRLTSPPRATFTTPASLEALGYAPEVARQLLDTQPAVVGDLALWAEADPARAKPANLYRAMALAGGLDGYDRERVGNDNGEMYFARDEATALSFGRSRVRTHAGTEGVMLHCQVPAFMVEMSPPQGGDASWPILRARNLPDPEHPDITAYVACTGSFTADSQAVAWNLA